MKKPGAATVAWYDAAVPADPRAVKGQMFGHPCAFVNGNMFFGTFADSVIARVGVPRAAELASGGELSIFEPMGGRPWKDYVQVETEAIGNAEIAHLAKEALEHTAKMPPKEKKAPKEKTAPKPKAAKTK